VSREFTLPKDWPIGTDGKLTTKPAYLTIKAYTYEGTPNAGKSYFTNFKLTKLAAQRPAPVAGGKDGTWSNEAGQGGTDREIALGAGKKPVPPKKKEAVPMENIQDAFK
jgi:hypothetical protein